MRALKTVISVAAVGAIALAAWVWVNTKPLTISEDFGIESAFETAFKTVPEHENLYTTLTYLNANVSDWLSGDEVDRLNQHLSGAQWDAAFVAATLRKTGPRLAALHTDVNRPYFQSGVPDWRVAAPIPAYQHYVSLGKLLTVQSAWHLRRAETEQAVQAFETGLKLARHLRHDENGSLIAYLIGEVILENQVQWVERQLQADQLPASMLVGLSDALKAHAQYVNDGFNKALLGEFLFMKVTMTDQIRVSFARRWQHYRETMPLVEDDTHLGNWSDDGTIVFDGLLGLIATLVPGYSLHANDLLNTRANAMRSLASMTHQSCAQMTYVKAELDKTDFAWWDALKPGILSTAMGAQDTTAYERYFERRCIAHTRLQAVRTLLALRQFEQRTGALPPDLTALVPEYLEQPPIDWLSGQPLRYAPDKAWVYSMGLQSTDRGGSAAAVLIKKCVFDASCIAQPTFSLRPVTNDALAAK